MGQKLGADNLARYADMTALLIRKHRTINELRELTGGSFRTVRHWLLALEEEDLVHRQPGAREGRGRGSEPDTYTWIGHRAEAS